MRNGLARYNLNHANVVGPRQCLIVSLLASASHPMLVSEVIKTFKLKTSASNLRATFKSMVSKGLVERDTSTAKPTSDGFFIGERWTVTAAGRALAKRIRRIEGLGNNFAVVRGHR